jgi:hypothetical protein
MKTVTAIKQCLTAFGFGLVTFSALAVCPFNADQQGVATGTATTDGLLFIRYALGLTAGASLGSGATQDGALPANIATYIDANKAALDMDGDGTFTPFDAQIVARYLMGFRGVGLQIGLSDPQFAKRFAGVDFQKFIDDGCTESPNADPRVQAWNAMNAALVAGNATLAKTYLTDTGLINHGPVMDALLTDMPTIVAGYSEIIPRYVAGDYAEYWVSRPIAGSTTGERYVHIVIFMRNPGDANWKIDSL